MPYIVKALEGSKGPIIAATDYMKTSAGSARAVAAGPAGSLGTDGFGRSDNREHLRRHFEINAESIAAAAFATGPRWQVRREEGQAGDQEPGIDPEKKNPAHA